jgi:outer membrane receptor for ferrienterochelin and colicins
LSFGNGFRVVNLFTEDHAATTGARQVVIKEELKPEKSYNVNLNYLKYIHTNFSVISLDVTLFYTHFLNKIMADYDTDPEKIIYDNLKGYAVSRGLSLNFEMNFDMPLVIRLGGTWMDVFQVDEDENGVRRKTSQILTEKASGAFAISYTWQKPQIMIDYTGNVYGAMRLPVFQNDFRPEYSQTYSIQNIQLTKSFKNGLQIYGGVKNLLNFTPPAHSIMRAFDPFDKQANDPVNNPHGYTFDPSYMYAPNQGIRGFLGVRWNFKG